MASYVFPKVEPVDIQRSRRDLSLYKAFTASAGTCIPCLSIDMLPSDWMRINTIATVQSLPMVAPVRGRWKCSFDYFYNPWSNIYGFMDNNSRLTTQQVVNLYRYVFTLGRNVTTSTFLNAIKGARVHNASVFDFLGCPVGYVGSISRTSTENSDNYSYTVTPTQHPAESFITYLDVVRNYYVNNQLPNVPYVASSDLGASNTYAYNSMPLSALDSFFPILRYMSNAGLAQPTDILSNAPSEISSYYNSSVGYHRSEQNIADYTQLGLFLRSYRMDLLRGTMNNSVGEFKAKVNITSDVSGSYITMDDTYFANKLQQFINRIDISGGRFSDWIKTRWNIDPGIEIDRPIYLGSHSLWLNTIDVVATASGEAYDVDTRNNKSILGQQVGYQVGKIVVGKGKNRQRSITIKSKQYGTLMCIFSIVPDVVYSQGFELNMLKTKFADIYDPAFKQLGFQDVLKAEMYAFPEISGRLDSTTPYPINTFVRNDLTTSVGKRIAWSEYMSSLGRSHGDFAYGQSLDFWVNNRSYTVAKSDFEFYPGETGDSDDLVDSFKSSTLSKIFGQFNATTYVYPHLWNNSFSRKDVYAQNYMVDVFFQIDANRALGKRLMPHM